MEALTPPPPAAKEPINYELPALHAVVIENDWTIPGSIRGLIKDHPTMFTKVDEVLYAKQRFREVEDSFKSGANAVLVSSTFMYKDQLEDAVTMFSKLPTAPYFFCDGLVSHLNQFLESNTWGFEDFPAFITSVKQWVDIGHVFSIGSNYNVMEYITDDCHNVYGVDGERARLPYIVHKVLFSVDHKVFYDDDDDQEDIIDMAKRTYRL